MSTSDCKDLLVEHYPQTQAKAWKRISKFKNLHDEEIRLFQHPEVGQVLVNEEEGEVSTDAADIRWVQASTLKASDFYFSIDFQPGDTILGESVASAAFVYKPFFEKEGCLDSIHLENVLTRLYPKGLICSEECEATFGFYGTDHSVDDLKRMFLEAGFLQDPRVDALFD